MDMPSTLKKGPQPLPEGSPFKGGSIVFGQKRPDLSPKGSQQKEASTISSQELADHNAFESAMVTLLNNTEAKKAGPT